MDFVKEKDIEKVTYLNERNKRLPIGTIMFYINKRIGKWEVNFGEIIDFYSNVPVLQLYDFRDGRLVNGIPAQEFETPSRWQKLPKKWASTYNYQLFEITFATYPEWLKECNLQNPDDIRKCIDEGVLVKVSDKDYSKFEAEISEGKGWRIVRRCDEDWMRRINTITIHPSDLYISWKGAYEVILEHEAELKRQSELSEYDWSVEQIDKTLGIWADMYQIASEEKQKYRDWILDLKRVEDVEVRAVGGNIQWKYWKNKRWMNIEL